MYQKIKTICLILITSIVVFGFITYLITIWKDDKRQKDISTGEIQYTEENLDFESAISRETYDRMKGQLDHHFVACFATKKLSCSDGICENLEPVTFWLLAGTISNGTISRCDYQGCDVYDSVAYQSGIFENVQPKKPLGFLFKRQVLGIAGNPADPELFIDVASIGLTTIISTGYCIETL